LARDLEDKRHRLIARSRLGAPSTPRLLKLTVPSQVLSYAQSVGWREGNPALDAARTLRERRDPIVLPDEGSIQAVFATCSPHLRALAIAARLTGCRQAELVGAKWTAFDEGAGTLEVIGKGNKRRTISLSPAARGHFAGQNRNTSAIFPSAEGGPWVSVPPAFAKTVHRAAPRVPFRFRDLRHMYAITPASLSQEVALGLGAQAGEGRLRQVATEAGFKRFRRATETPFNMIFEVRS
jgi:integrase/recombinase XerD